MSGRAAEVDQHMVDVVQEINLAVATIFDQLQPLATTTVAVLGDHTLDDELANALHRALEQPCRDVLATIDTPITGVGFVADIDRTGPIGAWMLWWIRSGAAIKQKQHVLNRESDSFYDYSNAQWFREARHGTAPFITSPYIDAWGTDSLTMTASIPVFTGGTFLGVVAADLKTENFCDQLIRILQRGEDITIVDHEDRVIASSIPVLTPGIPIRGFLRRSSQTVGDRHPCAYAEWSAVRFNPSPNS
ncbi:cache domain-containing protein [Kocuria sp. NPDC057446]|uniref:cache domain-containing protein n=1 Tax=Kocuria sp. NPDC057446 TaxID=3346137 RepID=UPI00367EBBEB